MKDDLPYFSHENNAVNHPKMKALRAQFGWEGYGRFWALNEAIARSKNVRLDLSMKVNRVTLALDLGLSAATFDEFLAFLSDPQECGLIQYQDGIVTTHQTIEDHARVMAERNRKRKDREPVIDFFPDQGHEDPETSAPEQENGAEPPRDPPETARRNRTYKSREEENRVEPLSPESKVSFFTLPEKKLYEEKISNEDPETMSTLRLPECLKLTPEHVSEATAIFGERTQEALDMIECKLLAHGYGYTVPWVGVTSWFVNAGGPIQWLDKVTGKATRTEGQTQRPEAYQPLHTTHEAAGDEIPPEDIANLLESTLHRNGV